MSTSLRQALSEMLRNWKDDLSAGWRSVLNNVSIDTENVQASLRHQFWEPIFPVRKGNRFPGARSDSHIFRGFDGLEPEDVKVVVLGQDPYPNAAQATGRAFEQGDLDSWPKEKQFIALSLRRIIQATAFARTDDRRYIDGDAAWETVVRDIESGDLRIKRKPRTQFDYWQRQGVMFLNTGLTLSRFEADYQFGGHLPLWKPVVTAVMQHLARIETPVVFLLWGGKARNGFKKAGVRQAAVEAGTWKRTVDTFACVHPAWPRRLDEAAGFLDPDKNTFIEANAALKRMGTSGIKW